MQKIELTGNLGSDAEYRNDNGNEFIKFNVGVTERFTKQDGTKVEQVTWHSCVLNGRQDNLLPYLKKGTRVFVRGDQKLRVFSSEKDRAMKAGSNVSVRELELIGAKAEPVPQQLCDEHGMLYSPVKYFWIPANEDGTRPTVLMNPKNTNERFNVDANGFIVLVAPASSADSTEITQKEEPKQEENVEVY